MIPPLGAPIGSRPLVAAAWHLQTKPGWWPYGQADVFELKGVPAPAASSSSAIPLDLDEPAMALNNTLSFVQLAWLKDCISLGGAVLVAYFGSWRGYQGFRQQSERDALCSTRLQALPCCAAPEHATPRSRQRNQQAAAAFYTQQKNTAQTERCLNLLAMLGTSGMSLSMLGSLQCLTAWASTNLLVNVLLSCSVPLVAFFGLYTAYAQVRTLQRLASLKDAALAAQKAPARQLLLNYLQRYRCLSYLKLVAALAVGLGAPLCLLFSPWWLLLMLPGTFLMMGLAPRLDALVPGVPTAAQCVALGSKTCLQQQILFEQAFIDQAQQQQRGGAEPKAALQQLWQHYWQTRQTYEAQQAAASVAKLARPDVAADTARQMAHQQRLAANRSRTAIPRLNLSNFLDQFNLWPLFIQRVLNDATLRHALLPAAQSSQQVEQANFKQRLAALHGAALTPLWELAYVTFCNDLLPAQCAQQNAWLQVLGERWRLQAAL